jgi:hypothetical protein
MVDYLSLCDMHPTDESAQRLLSGPEIQVDVKQEPKVEQSEISQPYSCVHSNSYLNPAPISIKTEANQGLHHLSRVSNSC